MVETVVWLQHTMSSPFFPYSLNLELNIVVKKLDSRDFPGGTVVKYPPANAGDTGSSPGPGRSHMLQSN